MTSLTALQQTPCSPLTKAEILEQLDPKAYTGRSGSQVTEFLRDVVRPLLEQLEMKI